MGYRPTTNCPSCDEPHDVYTEDLCECCKEMELINDAEANKNPTPSPKTNT